MDPASVARVPHTTISEQSRDYGASEQYARQSDVPRRIHILGVGSVGKLIAHSLRAIPGAPPITLVFHRPGLQNEWDRSKKEIVLETDGYRVAQSGYDTELVIPKLLNHGLEVKAGVPSLHDDPEATPPHQLAAMAKENQRGQQGLQLEIEESGPDQEQEGSQEPIHNLIVTVKAPRTISAIDSVKHRLLPTSTICFLQNGMGMIEDVNAIIFPNPETRPTYMQGIITHGVNVPPTAGSFFAIHAGHGTIALAILPRSSPLQSPHVLASNEPSSVLFPPTSRYLMRTLTRTPVLTAVGFPPLELLQQQLEKLATNAVLNPLTVILDARNGSILYNFALTRTMRLLLAEISLVLRALPELRGLPNINTRFSPERLETIVVAVAHKTRDNISSMLADVRSGTRTEIEYINGYIVKRGEELGLQCVCNYMLLQLVKGKYNMVAREKFDLVPFEKPDLTGERA